MTKLMAQVVKFGLVGVVATVLDFLILYILADFIGLHYLTAAALALDKEKRVLCPNLR